MSREHVQVVKAVWDAYGDGGLESALAYYASDCVVEDYPEMPDRSGVYEGWEGLRARDRHFADSWGEGIGEYDFRPIEFIDVGDAQVIVTIAMSVRGRGSGAPLQHEMAFVFEVRDGKIARDRAFISKEAALEAAGLRE